MIEIITQSPGWLAVFCILAGALLTYFLYRRDAGTSGIQRWLRWLMMSLRFLAITLLSFLLLTPLVRKLTRLTEKPIIVLAQDNSESIVTNKDSAFYRKDYPKKMNELVSALSGKFDVKTLSFGDKVREHPDFAYSEKQTDFSSLLDEIDVRYANRNIGALILASDGLYNSGSNPVYHDFKIPVYTVAMGDMTVQKDIKVGEVRFNKVVYLNSSFPLEIPVLGKQSSGEQTTLTLTEDSTVLFARQISISGSDFRQVVPVYLDAKKKGIHHYTASLSSIPGEITLSNNRKDIYIEVQESRRRVLIVADAPHPDIAAIRQSIESNENYQVTVATADHLPGDLKDVQLVILHQLPSTDHPAASLIRDIRENKIPCLYILGSQSNVAAFNLASAGVTIRNNLNKGNEIRAQVNPEFSFFAVEDAVTNAVRSYPPLIAPFGEYAISSQGSSLLTQKIGSISTSQPLLFLGEGSAGKTGVLAGEGCWRWRLMDYEQHGNFDIFNSLVSKVIQYLGTREIKTHLKVHCKNSFSENEPILMDAEVYDDNFDLVNEPDVSIAIINSAGKSFPYTFSKSDRVYSLNAGIFAPGDYEYKARVTTGGKLYSVEGKFSVNELQVEQNETVADHQLLYSLSQKTGGQLFPPDSLNVLAETLLQKEDLKTISYSQVKLIDLVDLKAFFYVLLGLLTLEWFLRKRSGGY